jgi:NADH dehydrogenase
LKGYPGVYALGDFSNIPGKDGKPLPQLASVAQQAGRYCAEHIVNQIRGRPTNPFKYFDKGIMAMVGRDAAVAELGEKRHELTGPVAFAAWLGVHAALLSTARARVGSIMDWMWDYFGRTHGERILDRPSGHLLDWGKDKEIEPSATNSFGAASQKFQT